MKFQEGVAYTLMLYTGTVLTGTYVGESDMLVGSTLKTEGEESDYEGVATFKQGSTEIHVAKSGIGAFVQGNYPGTFE